MNQEYKSGDRLVMLITSLPMTLLPSSLKKAIVSSARDAKDVPKRFGDCYKSRCTLKSKSLPP